MDAIEALRQIKVLASNSAAHNGYFPANTYGRMAEEYFKDLRRIRELATAALRSSA